MKFTKPFLGVPNGEIYPVQYQVGDECPPEFKDSVVALEGDAEHSRAQADAAPTILELLARKAELDGEAERNRVQAADNLAEASRLAELRAQLDADTKRLADDAAQLASDKAVFEAAKAATPAPATGKAKPAAAAPAPAA